MADAIVSVVVERIAAILEEQIRNQVKLVRDVEKEILRLSDELKTVRNVLDDAEKKGYKDKTVKDWLMSLEETAYEMDDVLDEWNYSVIKVQIEQHPKKKVWPFVSSPCLCFKKVVTRHDIALKVEEVKARLDLILAEKERFGFVTSQPTHPSRESWRVQTTSLIDLEEVCGREFESENLVSKLVGEGGSKEEYLGVRVVSIVGAGGLGKTTLAKLAYNDSRVKKCFELRIWICVSDTFNEIEIAKAIIEGARGSKPKTNQLEMVLQCLKDAISEKKFLLVLDDVWTEDDTKWEPLKICFKYGGVGSKILVTTRNERVAMMMGSVKNEIHQLGELSHDDCWLLLGRIALYGKNKEECEKFKDIGKIIAKKCKGLPLAAKTLGSLLRYKKTLEEWENVLDSEIWELEEVEGNLFPHLLLSYNELSPALKRCFSYCAVFPKDTEIDVESLIKQWIALGYLQSNGDRKVRGREYFDNLAMCSLFQDFDKGYLDEHIESFKMHDIVHDFAQFLRKDMRSGKKKTTCKDCSPLLVSQVEKYRSLFQCKEVPDPHLCDCLTSLRLLKLRKCGLQGIPNEIEKLIHLRWLDLGRNEFSDGNLKTICKLYNLQFLWVDRCGLKEIPWEIGNLTHLIELDMSENGLVKDLPESLCNLHELESLNVSACWELCGLPQGLQRLVNLKHLNNSGTSYRVAQFPPGLAELDSLVTLKEFGRHGGRDGNKLGWLKNLNRLSGSLTLKIEITSGDSEAVEDAREAELGKKIHIQELVIDFRGTTTGDEVWIHVLDALQPHPNLQDLIIQWYNGSRLPRWIASPLNQLGSITIEDCAFLPLLPPLGKLPLLKILRIHDLTKLEVVGREFLGITTTTCSSSSNIIGFPKLRFLTFQDCDNWKEWEDITAEEEEDFGDVTLMPCVTELTIISCKGLTELPHRLLRKVSSSLEVLDISHSTQLEQVYGDEDGQAWQSISLYNPHLRLRN